MTAAAAKPRSSLTLNVFPGGFNWPSFAALDKGFFAANGLEVTLQPTPNSVAQMTGLATGAFDVAMTAVDNIVAYVEGRGEAPIGPQPDFFAFMGSDNGFLSLVAHPEIKRIDDLRGKTLSVDARTTGYAFVLLDMLRRGGLAESDYQIVKVGGMVQRWDALRDGKQDATLLSAPYDILADAQGFNRVVRATTMIGRYQGNVAAAKRSWATTHVEEVVGFIRAYVTAIDWLYDAANRDEAVRILTRHLPRMPSALAQRSYDLLLDREEGFFRRGKIDLDGLETVLQLRSRHAEPKAVLTDPARYYDPTYHGMAMRR
jgi:ABC-type nitrate/sulfonate/bicarbonate transport system substrate-binding protein